VAPKAARAAAAGGCGCIFIGILGLVLFMGAIFAYTSIVAEETWFLPGEAAHFDPVAAFDQVQDHAGPGARLVRFEARFVRADGTLDLTATYRPAPTAEYTFARPLASPPKNAPPLGTGRRPDDSWFEPVTVKVSRPWEFRSVSRSDGGVRTRYQYFNLGMAREAQRPQSGPEPAFAARPSCALRDFWKVAEGGGASGDSVAVVDYDAAGYRFRIEGTPIDLAFGPDCGPRPARP